MNTDSINFQVSAVDLGDFAGWHNWFLQKTEGLPELISTFSDLLQTNSNVGLVVLGGLFASLLIFFRAANLMTSGSNNYQPMERDANSELLFSTAYKPRLEGIEEERSGLNIVLSSPGGEVFASNLEDAEELEEEDNLIVMKKRFAENRNKKKPSKAA